MVNLDPRFTSLVSFLTIIGFYYMVLIRGMRSLLVGDPLTIFTLTLWTLIFISSWGFSARDVKTTAGVQSVSKLKFKMQFALFVFNTFVGIAFVALVIIGTETVMGVSPSVISENLLRLIIAFLLIHPLIEFKILAEPGEDSSLPAEYYIEIFLESISRKLHSTTLASILAYLAFYIIPIALLSLALSVNLVTGAILWALMFPMINLGALAGTGLGEDLMRIRMIRKGRFFSDFNALGWPRISFRDKETGDFRYIPQIQVGGIFLVLLAVQAVITTAVFTLSNILKTFQEVDEKVPTLFVILTVALVLINKGRGALKELLGVWKEGGFKINVLPLFLAVFVLLGVVLSSVLEVFIGLDQGRQSETVLGALGMGEHRTILALFLALQNIALIISALWIFFKPPMSAESRLVREVPDFYKDKEGWVYFYENLKSNRAIEEMLKQTTKAVAKDLNKLPLLLEMIEDGLDSKDKGISVTASKAMYLIVKNVKELDQAIYPTLKKAMLSGFTGAQIYAMRAVQFYVDGLTNEELLDIIDDLMEFFSEEDVSVRWEASKTLRKILKTNQEMSGYILSKLVQSLASKSDTDQDSIIQFLNKASKDNEQLGKMAISTLTTQLSNMDQKDDNALILAIRQVVRARPELGRELDTVLRSELNSISEQHRVSAVKILSTLLEYKYGNVDAIAILIIGSVHDESLDVKREVVESLTKSIYNIPEKIDLVLDEMSLVYGEADEIVQLKSYALFEKIAEIKPETATRIYELVSAEKTMSVHFISLLGRIASGSEKYRDRIIDILEEELSYDNARIQREVLDALTYFVKNVTDYAGRIYDMVRFNLDKLSDHSKYNVLSLLSTITISKKDKVAEIFEIAKKEIKHSDWQVRSVAFNTMIRCLRIDRSLSKELTPTLKIALQDIEPNVRLEVVNYVSELLTQRSDITEDILEIAKGLLRSKNHELHSTALLLFNTIVEEKPRYSDEVLRQIQNSYEERDTYARIAILEVLRNSLEKASRYNIKEKVISVNITSAMQAANNSNIGIRRSAYDAITIVAETLPASKHAVRCRKAIDKALNGQEKDPSLLEFLDECRIRALPRRVSR